MAEIHFNDLPPTKSERLWQEDCAWAKEVVAKLAENPGEWAEVFKQEPSDEGRQAMHRKARALEEFFPYHNVQERFHYDTEDGFDHIYARYPKRFRDRSHFGSLFNFNRT
jgi:hypothetical protein